MVRTLAVYAPCAVIAQLVTWCFAAYCVLYAPIKWYGTWPYLSFVGSITLILGAAWGLIWLIDRAYTRNKTLEPKNEVRITGVRRLVKVYMESRLHSKICPVVEFEDIDA